MNDFLRDDILVQNNDSKYKIFSDLVTISIWTIATSISIIAIPENVYIRTILAVPMILFIPGYLLAAVLFPRKDDVGSLVERIAMSLGLSIVVISILGFLLNLTFGIKLVPILITICLYTIVLIFIISYRREKLSEDIQFSIQYHRMYGAISDWLKPKNRMDYMATIILIFIVTLTISMVYYTVAIPKIGERFTEFYILDSSGEMNNYSTNLKLNSPATWLVSVTNREYELTNYTVQVVIDKNILVSRQLTLDHNQRWEKNITLIPDKESTNEKLEFLLFKENNFTTPYRSLYLWIKTM